MFTTLLHIYFLHNLCSKFVLLRLFITLVYNFCSQLCSQLFVPYARTMKKTIMSTIFRLNPKLRIVKKMFCLLFLTDMRIRKCFVNITTFLAHNLWMFKTVSLKQISTKNTHTHTHTQNCGIIFKWSRIKLFWGKFQDPKNLSVEGFQLFSCLRLSNWHKSRYFNRNLS